MFPLPHRLSLPCRAKAGIGIKSVGLTVSPQSDPQTSACGLLIKEEMRETAPSNQSRRREERLRKKEAQAWGLPGTQGPQLKVMSSEGLPSLAPTVPRPPPSFYTNPYWSRLFSHLEG